MLEPEPYIPVSEEAVMRVPMLSAVSTLLVISMAGASAAQTVDDVVAKNLQAKGGAEKWKAVSSVKMSGRIVMQGVPAMQDMELPLTVYAKRPNYTRQEFVIQNQKIVQGFDGNVGWTINPMMGTEVAQELPPQVSESMRNLSDFDGPLIDYKAKGNLVELIGKEKVDTTDVFHLKVTTKSGQIQHYFLDAATGAEVKKTVELGPEGGPKQTLETDAEYQKIDGILVPKTIRQLMNGKPVVQMTIDKVEFNGASDDALFKMPKK
jgi:outer membrane lipoprotein-sorting protein